MAPHSSTLAWNIPWAEEPGGLHSMGSRRVGHDWAPSLSPFTFMHWRRKLQPTPVFLPGESQVGWGGAWWAAVYGVAQSRTRLKPLSSSSSSTQEKWQCKIPIRRSGSRSLVLKHKNKLLLSFARTWPSRQVRWVIPETLHNQVDGAIEKITSASVDTSKKLAP